MIKHELADLFWKNSVHKKFVINYDGGTITNSDLFMEEFSLEESICSEEELRFGSCEASVIKFPISNVFTSLNGKVLDVSVVLDHNEDKPLKIGKYKVASDVPTADRKRKDITAYDALYDVINADVSDWYNALLPNADSTVTLKQFRDSFFGYFGIEQVEVSLINDAMIVTKTIQPTELSGSVVVNAICELNGCFGHINRDGLMDYVFLKGFTEALYPSDNLYPAEDLFPEDSNYHKYTKSDYPSGGCDYQEYVVRKITGLEIRQAENSVGAFVGERDNPYVVSDNFLTYGKSAEEMTTIAQNMLNVINGIEYRPFTLNTFRGNPCVEVGDGIKIYTDNQIIQSYVLNRTLTGIQSLHDDFETNGKEYRSAQVNSVEKSIIQLRGKTNVLERNIDETRSEITKVETKANEYTDEKLKDYPTTEIMNSAISQSAESITLRVDGKITETKEYTDNAASTATSNANSATDEKLKSYSTTTEMQGKIEASAEAITAEVSKTYTTKTETETLSETLSSSIKQTADMIAIGIDANGNLVTDLTLDANGMTFVGNYIVIDTANLKLDANGAQFSGYVDATTFYVKDGVYMYGGGITLPIQARKIISWDTSSIDDYKPLVIGDGRSDVNIKNLKANLAGKVECTDLTMRIPIGTSNSGNYDVAYINSKPKESENSPWHITVNGKWGASEFASHNIYSGSSDVRLKENIENTKINNAIEIIEKIKVREFDWKNNGGHQKIGFVADELEEIDKSLAFGGGYEENGTPNYKTVNGFYLQGYEIKAIQELSAENKELKAEIDELKKSVSFLMEKLGGMSNE